MVVAVDGEGWVMVQVSHCLICSILRALLWSQGSLQSSKNRETKFCQASSMLLLFQHRTC